MGSRKLPLGRRSRPGDVWVRCLDRQHGHCVMRRGRLSAFTPPRRRMRSFIPFVLSVLCLSSRSQLQAQAFPDSGARVRIASPQLAGGRTAGLVERLTPDTIVVAGRAISRSSITRIDLSSGRRSQWRKGMGIGAATGFAIGAIVGVVGCQGYDVDGLPLICAGFLGGAGGVLGLGIGGLLGSTTQGEAWSRIPLARIRATPIVRGTGEFGLSFGLPF